MPIASGRSHFFRLFAALITWTFMGTQMCRRAGVAFGAFGAALDVEYARLEDKKKELASWSGSEANGNAAANATGAMSNRRSSGAPRSSTEPLRSELLAMQLVECANEMEDDLREQVWFFIESRQEMTVRWYSSCVLVAIEFNKSGRASNVVWLGFDVNSFGARGLLLLLTAQPHERWSTTITG